MTINGQINSILDNTEKNLKSVFKKLMVRIEEIVIDIQISRDAPSLQYLRQAQDAQAAIFDEINKKFGQFNKTLEFEKIEKLALKLLKENGIETTYTAFDDTLFSSLRRQTISGMNFLSAQTANSIAQDLYDVVLVSGSKHDLIKRIRGKLIGAKGITGRPLSTYAQLYAHDSLMEYFSRINVTKSFQAGIQKFRYRGSLMKTSRPWCVNHAGKVFTKAEINSWNGETWRGKKPGNVWVNRGGYNCRHYFTPEIEE